MDNWNTRQGDEIGMEYMMNMMSAQHKSQQQEYTEHITKLGNRYKKWNRPPHWKWGSPRRRSEQEHQYPYPPYGNNPYEGWKENWKEIVEQRQKHKKEAEEAAKEEARKEREKRISRRRANGINRIRGL